MQQAPGQQAPPPQQPASLDEIDVTLVSAIIAAIKSRYFMIFSCRDFVNPRLRERVRRAYVPRAEPESLRENHLRGGGTGGLSIRAEAVVSAVENAWLVKPGVKKPSDVGQKRISVEHETVQQLRGCDWRSPHRFSGDVRSCIILHRDILEQQSDGFGMAITFDLPAEGQRKVARHTINNALTPALRMTTSAYRGVDPNQSVLSELGGLV